MNKILRTVKKKQGDEWIIVRLADVEVGDTFIMFDDDIQVGGKWLAESNPSLKDSVWGIVARELV